MNEQQITGGATIWARKTIDSKIFYEKPAEWFKIWFFLINRVNHRKYREWDRGECHILPSEIAEKTKATSDQVKKCLTYLRRSGMISTRRSTRGITLKVLKYNTFQDFDNYTSTESGTREALEKHQRSTTINKNDKNVKNEKNNTSDLKVAGVEDIMKIFYKINPSLNWGNKTTRKACEWLIKKYTKDGAIKMAEAVVSTYGKPYAPVATTPYQMKEKLSQFKVYFDSQKNKQDKFSVTKIS